MYTVSSISCITRLLQLEYEWCGDKHWAYYGRTNVGRDCSNPLLLHGVDKQPAAPLRVVLQAGCFQCLAAADDGGHSGQTVMALISHLSRTAIQPGLDTALMLALYRPNVISGTLRHQ